ncbi:MetQ/NlpA family ABC transporter substrate-binding protein [Janibacter limosus]|jgi:D-methionine transport system substrate-binding protein|uniref:Lipoprotein n=1 Tax=Janibacter limosus TaxID=53458 RepID=A0A4P6MVC4_9MICO|nr:MetQ/NlpA family ABC transporter substrate-binding protein [Janibacter limosus]QBF45775.1 ABC transporter substrate-binding protein [Janibacter limosus]
MSPFRSTTRAAAVIVVTSLGLSACGLAEGDSEGPTADDKGVTTITVGASPTPHAKILEYVDTELAPAAKIDLDIKTFDDYIQPNVQLSEGTLDANYYQHLPYYEEQVEDRGYDFAHYKGIHIEPFALYSDKVKDVKDLKSGAQIGINNDPSNQGRALQLLADNDVITLKEGKDATNATIFDVADNPKKLTFKETDPAQLARSLQDLDAAVINGNYAIEADLSTTDALVVEDGKDSPYANFLAVQKANEDNPGLKKLDELLHSPEVKAYIEKTWPNGEVLPAF